MLEGHSYISGSRRLQPLILSTPSLFLPFRVSPTVRPGLVAIGLALVLVGAVVGYTGLSIPGVSVPAGFTETISAPNVAPSHERVDVISVMNTSSGTFAISWTSTQNLNVSLYQGVACTSASHYCESGLALARWPANSSGNWKHAGGIVNPYLLTIQNLEATNVSLAGSLAESYPGGTGAPPASAVVTILAGAVLLVAIGGMALFLGLFLRGGVYSEPESVTPRYAHELESPGDPLDEPFDEDPQPDEEPPGARRAH